MPVKIIRLHFLELWNNEYPLLVNQLSVLTANHNPDLLHLTKSLARVNAMLPQLSKIRAQELSNAITNKLRDISNERKTLVSGINSQVKTFSKLSMPSLALQVETMKRFLNIHTPGFADANYPSGTQRTTDMLADFDSKPEVRAAAESMHLTTFFDQLRAINIQFSPLYLQRTQEDAAAETVDAHAIRSESDKEVIALLDAIEYCSREYEELDYQPLANELNNLIGHYKTQLKARTTRRNAGKDVSNEAPITGAQ